MVSPRVLGSGVAILVLAVYAPRLLELYSFWCADPNYSHGFLVPLVSGFFAYQVVRERGLPQGGDLQAGLVWFVGGCCLHLLALLVWWPLVDCLALSALLYGIAVLLGGRSWARNFLFPIFFLFFMFPLPVSVTEKAALWLQGVVSNLAAPILGIFIPAFQQGNQIHLPGQRLEVGEACSGLRQVVAFSALTCIVVYCQRRHWVANVCLLASAPVVAILANVLRVLLMAVVLLYGGEKWISGIYHDLWGLVGMAAGLVLLLLVSKWLNHVLVGTAEAAASAEGVIPAPSTSLVGVSSDREFRRLGLGVAMVCLGVTLAGQWGLGQYLTAGQMPTPPELENGVLKSFPVSVGAWSGESVSSARLPSSVRDYYNEADDQFCGNFSDDGRLVCNLWMIHRRDGKDREHHPDICYKVIGSQPEAEGNKEIVVPDQAEPIRRLCYTDGRQKTYVFYWHYTLEPPAAAEAALSPLQRFHLRRTQRLPSVTVEVFTNAQSPQELDRAEQFVKAVDATLRPRLPSTARLGSQALPIRYTGAAR